MALADYEEYLPEQGTLAQYQEPRVINVTPRDQERRERVKRALELQATDPNVQAFLAREQESRALAQAFQANPQLQAQFLMKQAEARLPQKAAPAPAGYRPTADGGLTFIKGGPADPEHAAALRPRPEKPITEFQGKNSLYGSRALMSDKILNDLEEKINTVELSAKQALEKTPLLGGAMGVAGNWMISKDQQRVDQAQRNFVNAVLRQESGAVISEPEFENAKKQYFAQSGDSKEVIAQKRANRKLVIEGFKKMAGPAWSEEGENEISKVVAPSPASGKLSADEQKELDQLRARFGKRP